MLIFQLTLTGGHAHSSSKNYVDVFGAVKSQESQKTVLWLYVIEDWNVTFKERILTHHHPQNGFI